MNKHNQIIFFIFILLLSGCTAHYPVIEPIDSIDNKGGYRPEITQAGEDRSDSLLVALAFSGGGTRAAAFSYGVLEALRDITIHWEGRERRLIDEVDTISSVSGGSFTAAYFGLFGDRIFEDFEDKFLKKDVEGYLTGSLFKPWTWPRIGSTFFGRSDFAADYYDEILFEHKTFADIMARKGPFIQVNATEVSTGLQFVFVQGYFDLLCMDLASYPVSRAVTASSAVPVLFSSITIDNHAGSCGYQMPEWVQAALEDPDITSRRRHLAQKFAKFLDQDTYPYLHLYDGGLTDNLGVRSVINRMILLGDAWKLAKFSGKADIKRLLIIVVNAQAEAKTHYSKLASPVPLMDTIMEATSIPLNEQTFESLVTLQAMVDNLGKSFVAGRCAERAGRGEDTTGCDDFKDYLVYVDLDLLKDREKKVQLKQLPTSFVLKPEEVDGLRDAARTVLNESREFRNFLEDLK
jgi:NTE family protein